jgi:hypothetical protein
MTQQDVIRILEKTDEWMTPKEIVAKLDDLSYGSVINALGKLYPYFIEKLDCGFIKLNEYAGFKRRVVKRRIQHNV